MTSILIYKIFNLDKNVISYLIKCIFQKVKKKVYFSKYKLLIEYFSNYPKKLWWIPCSSKFISDMLKFWSNYWKVDPTFSSKFPVEEWIYKKKFPYAILIRNKLNKIHIFYYFFNSSKEILFFILFVFFILLMVTNWSYSVSRIKLKLVWSKSKKICFELNHKLSYYLWF